VVRVAVYGERGPVSTHQVSYFILFLVAVLLVPEDVSVSDRVVVIGRGVSRRAPRARVCGWLILCVIMCVCVRVCARARARVIVVAAQTRRGSECESRKKKMSEYPSQ
jgi:hypothetical protein